MELDDQVQLPFLDVLVSATRAHRYPVCLFKNTYPCTENIEGFGQSKTIVPFQMNSSIVSLKGTL